MSDKVSFEGSGNAFQEALFRNMFYDRTFMDQISEIMQFDFFSKTHLRFFYRKLNDFKKKYKIHPTMEGFDRHVPIMISEDHSDKVLQMELKEFWDEFKEQTALQPDDDAVKDRALEFCQTQHLKATVKKSAEMLLRKTDPDEIKAFMAKENLKGGEGNCGLDMLEDIDSRYEEDERDPIPFPWEFLNKATQGGGGRGELTLFGAGSGFGKTHLLCDIGSHDYIEGYNVAFVTLELPKGVIAKRSDANIMRTNIEVMGSKENKIKLYNALKDTQDTHKNYYDVSKYVSGKFTTDDLRNHLHRLTSLKGASPDVILVDYADKMKPLQRGREKRHELLEILEELRNIGIEFNAHIVTVSQLNKIGYKTALALPTELAEAFSKLDVLDLMITMAGTVQDKADWFCNWYVGKNRNGFDATAFRMYNDKRQSWFKLIKQLTGSEIAQLISKNKEKKWD